MTVTTWLSPEKRWYFTIFSWFQIWIVPCRCPGSKSDRQWQQLLQQHQTQNGVGCNRSAGHWRLLRLPCQIPGGQSQCTVPVWQWIYHNLKTQWLRRQHQMGRDYYVQRGGRFFHHQKQIVRIIRRISKAHQRPAQSYSGSSRYQPTNFITTNVGNMENKGIELILNTTPTSWLDLSVNLTHNVPKITKLTKVDDPTYKGVATGGIAGGGDPTFRYILWVMHQVHFTYTNNCMMKTETSSRDNTKM